MAVDKLKVAQNFEEVGGNFEVVEVVDCNFEEVGCNFEVVEVVDCNFEEVGCNFDLEVVEYNFEVVVEAGCNFDLVVEEYNSMEVGHNLVDSCNCYHLEV
jgi:hypothetical protein